MTADNQPIAFLEADPVAADTLYQNWLDAKRNKISRYDICSCVSYAKYKSGINVGSIGAAKNHPINSNLPAVGAIVVMNVNSQGAYNTGHLGVVLSFTENSVTITEANYVHCAISTRTMALSDTSIRGYFILQ